MIISRQNIVGDDLIVSFAVDDETPGEVLSVILVRTPKFEHLLEPAERGVRVSHERYPDADDEYLRRPGGYLKLPHLWLPKIPHLLGGRTRRS